ncbi:MAG TPA: hypothetical protein VIZ30_10895, partial [Pseudomonadales bacterium]
MFEATSNGLIRDRSDTDWNDAVNTEIVSPHGVLQDPVVGEGTGDRPGTARQRRSNDSASATALAPQDHR